MKYVYQGEYIQLAGRMFAFGKPVEVSDRATIQLLDSRPDFRRVPDGVREEEKKEVLADQCPKCGKIVKRGKVMHQKWCKG